MDRNLSLTITTKIVANYVSNNKISLEALKGLIDTVDATINALGAPIEDVHAISASPTATQIRKSIRQDGLISFIDGKVYKTLKRHVAANGMTLEQYKEKFGLPATYPHTAPEYSARRSEMARSIGLGQNPRKPKEAVVATTTARRRSSVT